MRTKKGIITGTKMKDTVTVTVHRLVFHPIYKKRYRKSKKFLCDSNGKDLYVGDEVEIAECRPLSKHKCFKVTEILKAAPRVSDVKEDKAVEEVLHREKKGADADAKAAKAEEAKKKAEAKEEAKEDAGDSDAGSTETDASTEEESTPESE